MSEAFNLKCSTLLDQSVVEKLITAKYEKLKLSPDATKWQQLKRARHLRYLERGLAYLPPEFVCLDASRPWLCYWILHSMALLGRSVDEKLATRCIDTLSRCQDPNGGFGGGPSQIPHLATTYAAVCALVTIGGKKALSAINRKSLLEFLLRMKNPDGSFFMHDDGEIDVRGCYTAVAVAKMLNILTPELCQNVGKYIRSCQTYEGGISAFPGSEAHGGYTFCGLAAAMIVQQERELNLPLLLDWCVFRQQKTEGGFQGRCNKLVDGCYSFWQGGLFNLLKMAFPDLLSQYRHGISLSGAKQAEEGEEGENLSILTLLAGPLYNTRFLQGYILACCQDPDGGLIDKPGKPRDYYHSCYCLSGLSSAQYVNADYPLCPDEDDVLGPYSNLLEATEPLCNVCVGKYLEAIEYFSEK